MSIDFYFIGKTNEEYLKTGISEYIKRLGKYANVKIIELQLPKKYKNMPTENLKKAEAEKVLSKLSSKDYVIVLDEIGKSLSSKELAVFISKKMTESVSSICFVVGGAFGIDSQLKKRADLILSFSKMTFSHQMIRLFLVEQTYRAFSIINNSAYHH